MADELTFGGKPLDEKAKAVRRAMMIAAEPLPFRPNPEEYRKLDPDARAAWKADQEARAGKVTPPGTPERDANFKKWFRDSKTVNKAGEPLRLYHITKNNFTSFHPGGDQNWRKLKKQSDFHSGPATWLSPYPDLQPAAHQVGGFEGKFKDGAAVMPVHARISNPLVIDNKAKNDAAKANYGADSFGFPLALSPKTRDLLLADGYDGILYAGRTAVTGDEPYYDKNEIGSHPDKSEEIVALHPDNYFGAQIKSATGNSGRYGDDSHINYAHGGDVGSKRALMIARDQRALLRRIANIYPGPGGGMDPSPGGGGYSGPGGGKYIGPSHYADGGKVEPTEAQKHAGNYRKQHLSFHGLPISIETPKGAKREGVDPNGKAWSVTMPADYGYIKRTEGADGDHVDVYLGPERHSQMVFLINQHDHMTSRFDEHKVMLGYTSERAAVDAYEKAFSDGKGRQRIGSVEPMSLDAFKHWLKNGRTTKPAKTKHIIESRIARATGGSVPPFKLHSGAAKLIAAKGQKKATPQQYAAMPGIKPDELKHSKFDTLGSKALPREEVIKHLEDNAVPLQETVLGENTSNHRVRYNEDTREYDVMSPDGRVYDSYRGDEQGHEDAIRAAGTVSGTKFDSYQLPGGQNYREVLLHTPKPREFATVDEEDNVVGRFDNYISARDATTHGSREGLSVAVIKPNGDIDYDKNPAHHVTDSFQSAHWDEPNVVAHARMSDRVGPNGEKILHLEEAQSDWGQKGREKGFSNPEVANRQRELFQKLNDIKKAHVEAQRDVETKHKINLREFDAAYKDAMGDAESKFNASRMTKSDIDAYNEASDLALTKTQHLLDPAEKIRQEAHKQIHTAFAPKIEALEKEFSALPKHGDIPQGPYVDNTQKWTDLALKRVLHEAAHGGYDKIVVTPGEEQAKRYPENDEEAKAAREHGMKGYYDNILPKRLQALAQQHDPQAKVNLHAHDLAAKPSDPFEEHKQHYADSYQAFEGQPHANDAELRNWARDFSPDDFHGVDDDPVKAAPLHSLDVTPQMRDSIKANGFNSFKRGGDVDVAKKPSTPTIKKTLDLRPAEAFPELATRYPETAPPEWAHDPKKKVDYLAKRLSPEALAVQTAKKVIQKDIEEGRYKPYFDPLKRYDASSPEFGVKTPTTGIKKVKPETQAKYEAHARSPEATTRLSAAFERGMLQPREASDWYLMGQLHNEYVAKHGPKLGSQLFKERFADAMSATTGGADPTSNFLTSHYGNYVKAHKQQFPEKSYDLPFPIGGRYIGGNIDQFDKMIMQGKGVTPANPKRYNFSHNFLGDDSGSTIDEQMSGLYDPKMSVPPEGTYGHYEGALADLAKQTKGAKSPRHFQEVAWAGAKDMGTKGGYRASPMISHINQSIERTSRLTGLSPDEVVAQNLVDVKGPMFKKGGRAGYALSGRVEQLGRDLHQSFGDLNRQVAAAPQQQAPAGGDYKAMLERATGQAPNDAYQRMLAQALNGKTYEEMFPTAAKPAAPAAPVAAAAAPAAAEQSADANKWMTDYGSWMTSLMGGGGDGLKRGGRANKTVERALAITRKVKHG